jgi:hypothetical protein
MKHGAWEDWGKRAPRNSKGNQYALVKAPEWAYCSADRFEELRYQAWFLKTTIENMQGGWDYPAEEGIKIQ